MRSSRVRWLIECVLDALESIGDAYIEMWRQLKRAKWYHWFVAIVYVAMVVILGMAWPT